MNQMNREHDEEEDDRISTALEGGDGLVRECLGSGVCGTA